ncbi:MAG: AbiA family abortive infection protein [Lachnospiraceae bacterium]|nr:AbiA family abortive infection protein [Lachnospiraceae bacterium]
MLGIEFSTWTSICSAYRLIGEGAKKASLQWFPFTNLSEKDWDYLTDRDFYEIYIRNASFVFLEKAMHQSENYIQKSDGSFRDASLVSPLLYLVLQAIGYEIARKYDSKRAKDISVFYAGNYDEINVRYKREYDAFFKEINSYQEEYKYYIKTDITSFFSNINLDKLVERIDCVCNEDEAVFSQLRLQVYKRILEYSGAGRFPLIENSVMSSFLATVVYLDQVDCDLYDFLEQKIDSIINFKMIRYVDDLYILLSTKGDKDIAKATYNAVRNEYSSILKNWGLSLNSRKCKLGLTIDINQDLKKSLYDEFYNGEKHSIEELFAGSLECFLEKLSIIVEKECLDVEQYNDLIDEHFSFEDIEFTPAEVFNYFVYESDSQVKSKKVSGLIKSIIQKDISVLSLDPKRLGVMVMKTHNDSAIKATLNELFKRYRSDVWNSYDTTIAISYLVQSEFKHIDLLSILRKQAPSLHRYYYNNCRTSFVKQFNLGAARNKESFYKVIKEDWKAHYLYFMYYTERTKNNNLTAYAYFKSFFDRVTADLDYVNRLYNGEKIKRPNYKAFYKENIFLNFYANIEGSDTIIKKAHELRNGNPVSHSSAKIIEDDKTKDDIYRTISELSMVLRRYVVTEKIYLKV